MNSRFLFLIILFQAFICSYVWAQNSALNDVLKSFEQIDIDHPAIIHFKSAIVKEPRGGHLQGIQLYKSNKPRTFIITGSSAHFSFYVLAPENGEASIHKIADEPFRHAGGCQLAGGKLFAGLEDNHEKNKSNLVTLQPGDSTVKIIAKRKGAYKRSTAGGTGAVKIKNEYLVAVADWDSRNIDFYRSTNESFDSVATFSVPENVSWGAYQSINLLADTAWQLYLIGFCREKNKDRADLFSVKNYQLKLLSSRFFKCVKGCSFRYGAGIQITENGLELIASQRRLKKMNVANVFGVGNY